MTEAEWLTCADPEQMLTFNRDRFGNRKFRLFACACCRRVWHLLTEVGSRDLVTLTEQASDEEIDRKAFRDALLAAKASEIGGPWCQRAERNGLAFVHATGAAWAATGYGSTDDVAAAVDAA